jgi:Rieske 2Fe-2S family protein
MDAVRHPLSPRLDHCPVGLPKHAYLSDDWFAREQATLFARQWICAGRLADVAPGTMRRLRLGLAEVILCRGADGALSAFHNSCRHRGAELCRAEVEPLGALIRCPYHAFAYAADDGRLVATGPAVPTADFDRAAHGLLPVAIRVWAGFLFLSAAADPPPLRADVPLATLDHWPMDALVTGHRWTHDIACNWKVFWENYSECLHCPGIHPDLCDLVPVYRRGLMAPAEAADWTPETTAAPPLRPGAESWTPDGAPCGPAFPGLTAAERAAGHVFVTIWPSLYVVAHVDHVRSVRIEPVTTERTRLSVAWHFPAGTLARPGFDAARVAAFATRVLTEDGEAAAMNQRGLHSPSFHAARLMPEEYEIHRFHRWIRSAMESGA